MRSVSKSVAPSLKVVALLVVSVALVAGIGGSQASALDHAAPVADALLDALVTPEVVAPEVVAPEVAVPDVVASDSTIIVNSVETIRAALTSAKPGDVVHVVDGEYTFRPRAVASASGTSALPITLEGSKNVVFRTKDSSGDYGLHIKGDYWHVVGITFAHVTKGIVLDGSVGSVIDNVDIYDVGGEAVHFRTCSSDSVLRNSFIHQTGTKKPQYGEGVYVGSASSSWSKFRCTDIVEGVATGDNTERVIIEDNVFEDVPAEGVDIKEGTDSGVVRRNIFRRVGTSGMNSADSAVDVKGNNWIIEDNVVSDTDAPWIRDGKARASRFVDGFQAHSVYKGYGTQNIFRRNVVNGGLPGFGVGLYPGLANQVACDNTALNASKGLVGDASSASVCN